ncbi:hypothetical protein ACVWXM_001825 [Bradyrhizobium sp. GM7.3]
MKTTFKSSICTISSFWRENGILAGRDVSIRRRPRPCKNIFAVGRKAMEGSQPALSQAVQQIEKRFGVAIVLRHQSWISNAFAAP